MNLDHIRTITTTISAYLDKYDDKKLTKKETKAVIKIREKILKSLEVVQSGTKLSDKKIQKIIDSLDESFNEVITIFAKTKFSNAEITETIEHQKEKKSPVLQREDPISKEKPKAKVKREIKEPKVKESSGRSKPEQDEQLMMLMVTAAKQLDQVLTDQRNMQKLAAITSEALSDLFERVKTLEDELKKED